MTILRLQGICKNYGAIQALSGLNVDIPEGVICGLVGPNGAGKTTTFGVVSGCIRPNSGTVDIMGTGPFDARKHSGRLAVLPQDCELNPYIAVKTLMKYYARLQGLTTDEAAKDADSVLDLVGLSERADARIRQLSHGMRRRVAIAQTLLGNPGLILLDEPTSGLDPHLVVRLRDVFLEQGKKCTLIISSHNLAELEATCNYIIFMDAGRVVRSGSMTEMTSEGTTIRFTLDSQPPMEEVRSAIAGIDADYKGNKLTIHITDHWQPSDINKRILPILLENGIGIREIRSGKSLEDRYMEERKFK